MEMALNVLSQWVHLQRQILPVHCIQHIKPYRKFFSKPRMNTITQKFSWVSIDKIQRRPEWTANYNTSINGVHNITGLLGYSYQDFEYEQFSAENKNFLTDVFGTNNLEAGGYLKDGKAEMKSKKRPAN